MINSRKHRPYKKPILCDPDVKSYLETLRKRSVVITIDKAANNFAFICENCYNSKLLAEVSLSNSKCISFSKAPQAANSGKYKFLQKD